MVCIQLCLSVCAIRSRELLFVVYSVGTVDLTMLPSSLSYLSLFDNRLIGLCTAVCLCVSVRLCVPLDPENFYLLYSVGTVDLTMLPSSLSYLDLDSNQLSGLYTAVCLCVSVRAIRSSELLFVVYSVGTVDLTMLPSSLSYLHLNSNQLSGLYTAVCVCVCHYIQGTSICCVLCRDS